MFLNIHRLFYSIQLILIVCSLNVLAILLGHMRLSVGEIKTALTRMDDELLTDELLKQMIAYAPDEKEVPYNTTLNLS